jgi:hypothetical protein
MTRQRIFLATRVDNQSWTRWVLYGWALAAFIAYGPTVERLVFPVVSKLEIVSVATDGVGSQIYVKFEKLRSCQYLGMNWDEILPDGTRRRALLNLRPSDDNSGSTRPQGKFIAGPWYVGIPPEKLTTSSEAVIAYRCHPMWQTEAFVYP